MLNISNVYTSPSFFFLSPSCIGLCGWFCWWWSFWKWTTIHGLCSVTLLVLRFLYLLQDIWAG